MQSQRKSSGFTLIELMIVVVVVSILTSIAIPSYQNSVRKSRRTEAKAAVLDLAGREERFFSANNVYTSIIANLGYGTDTGPMTALPVGTGYYSVTVGVTGNPASTYTITANPLTADQQLDTACAFFTVTNTGAQSATSPNCWK